ncbi:MAG TPA: hypothetical protein VN578_21325 [Candidatus Binatia bacterium]|jgi:hypothetical protein|nr:hypothetical protein [Candidatus Binatia bacterium]
MLSDTDKQTATPPHRHHWPWFVLGAVALAIILAVLWMTREIERTRRLREFNAPSLKPN